MYNAPFPHFQSFMTRVPNVILEVSDENRDWSRGKSAKRNFEQLELPKTSRSAFNPQLDASALSGLWKNSSLRYCIFTARESRRTFMNFPAKSPNATRCIARKPIGLSSSWFFILDFRNIRWKAARRFFLNSVCLSFFLFFVDVLFSTLCTRASGLSRWYKTSKISAHRGTRELRDGGSIEWWWKLIA